MNMLSAMGLTPTTGLRILKIALEKTINKRVENYALIYYREKDMLMFKHEGKIYPYESDKILFLIKSLTKQHLKPTMSLDILVLHYSEKSKTTIDIFYTSENEKIKLTHTL